MGSPKRLAYEELDKHPKTKERGTDINTCSKWCVVTERRDAMAPTHWLVHGELIKLKSVGEVTTRSALRRASRHGGYRRCMAEMSLARHGMPRFLTDNS